MHDSYIMGNTEKHPKHMRIWTVQRKEVWEDLKRNGIAFCAVSPWTDEADQDNGKRAWEWMEEQMEQRIVMPRPADAKHPFWGWSQYRSHKVTYRPDMTHYNGRKYVFFELDIPDDELLLSDFLLWNAIQNGADFAWERIFYLHRQDRISPRHIRNKTIQATFWYIRESWIRSWRIC